MVRSIELREGSGCCSESKEHTLGFDDVETYVREFGANMPDARPSMLLDHLAKRPSEIDGINGAVPVEAKRSGCLLPLMNWFPI